MVAQKKRRADLGIAPQSVPYDFSDLVGEQAKQLMSAEIDDIITDLLPFWLWYIEEKHFHENFTV